jgi:hypothetical protein
MLPGPYCGGAAKNGSCHLPRYPQSASSPQRFLRPVVFQQCLETLCARQVLERQRTLTAVPTPPHAIGIPAAILLGMNACHNP